TKGFLSGHSFGNLFLGALAEKLGGFEAAVDYMHTLLGIKGQVIPCTLGLAQLHAKLKDGTHLEGEEKIDVTDDPKRSPVANIWIEPNVPANPRALKAIKTADVLIFGPGDFYTSILPTLLVTGMKDALAASTAKKILVCNRTQKPGETHGMSALDLVTELERYAGTHIDLLLANNQNKHTGPYPAIEVPWEELTARETEVVMADLANEKDGLRLNGTKVAQALATIWTV
ncbi:MAG: gluconeogenesis factor YvcK family protein, partial [Patescibacteria group bacterium]